MLPSLLNYDGGFDLSSTPFELELYTINIVMVVVISIF